MGKNLDLTNQKFGKLLVLHKTENPKSKSKHIFWLCKCDCGEESIVSTSDLSSGKTTQCWKCAHIATGKHKRINLIGNRYGKLVVKDMIYGEKDKSGRQRTYCNCICDCGNEIVRLIDSLLRAEKNGSLCSCGCGNVKQWIKFQLILLVKDLGI